MRATATRRQASNAAWVLRDAPWPQDVVAAVAGWCGREEVAWLDSSAAGDANRWSLIAGPPLATVSQRVGEPARLEANGRLIEADGNAWRLWWSAQRRLPRWPQLEPGLGPGWIGFAGFELAAQLERLPAAPRGGLGMPLLRFTLHEQAIVLDHLTRRAMLVAARGLRSALGLARGEGVEAATERWAAAAGATRAPSDGGAAGRSLAASVDFEMPRADFERRVERALAYIAAGDIYQVNLAQRVRLALRADALATYAAMRRVNPAPLGALHAWRGADGGRRAVASVSPELFLRVRGRAVLTRPIKGTRPRGADAAEDAAQRAALWASEKDAAELAMIIDLHRNDLGRVCRPGSVRVVAPRRIEAHPRVFHTVGDVAGELAAGRDGLDLLRAAFPAGSISGVPKIRALQIIRELEPVPREAYSGAIGAWGLDGGLALSVAIRTLQVHDAAGVLHVGGGIVAESEPGAEYEETLAKARGILEALGPSRLPA